MVWREFRASRARYRAAGWSARPLPAGGGGAASHWTSDASPVFIGTGSTMRASSTASAIAGGAASAGNPVFLESGVFF